MNRLFVYGIFLGEDNRTRYGMSNPLYATVPGYVTYGDYIVQAVPVPIAEIALTGLTVDVDPSKWGSIDQLEGNYDRIKVTTSDGERVYMYAQKASA